MYQYNHRSEPMFSKSSPRHFTKILRSVKQLTKVYDEDPRIHVIQCVVSLPSGQCHPAVIALDTGKNIITCAVKLRGRCVTSEAMMRTLLRLQSTLSGPGTVTFDEESRALKVCAAVPFADADNVHPVINAMLDDVQDILQNDMLRVLTN